MTLFNAFCEHRRVAIHFETENPHPPPPPTPWAPVIICTGSTILLLQSHPWYARKDLIVRYLLTSQLVPINPSGHWHL